MELGGWNSGRDHDLAGYALARRHGPQHGPRADPSLLQGPNEWKSFLDGPYPSATRTITLTTTWAGTATNPFTGDTQTINGLVTTTETTGPFPLSQLIVNNTDTSEEKQGH